MSVVLTRGTQVPYVAPTTDPEAQALWKAVFGRFLTRIEANTTMRDMLQNLKLQALHNTVVVITASNTFTRIWVRDNHLTELLDCWNAVKPGITQVRLVERDMIKANARREAPLERVPDTYDRPRGYNSGVISHPVRMALPAPVQLALPAPEPRAPKREPKSIHHNLQILIEAAMAHFKISESKLMVATKTPQRALQITMYVAVFLFPDTPTLHISQALGGFSPNVVLKMHKKIVEEERMSRELSDSVGELIEAYHERIKTAKTASAADDPVIR